MSKYETGAGIPTSSWIGTRNFLIFEAYEIIPNLKAILNQDFIYEILFIKKF